MTTARKRTIASPQTAPAVLMVLCAWVAIQPVKVRAQQQTDLSVAAATAGKDSMQEIVVTARKRSETLLTVPESISVFTSQNIEDARIRSIDDFVQLTPSFQIIHQESAGVFEMTIRGITQTNQGDAPVTMVVDGVTLPYANSFGKPLFDIQQIEVLKGPQGDLYGQNAIGGAVIVTTKQPTNHFEGHVTGSAGNYGSAQISSAISGPIIDDRVLFRVSGFVNYDGGDTPYAYYPQSKYGILNQQGLRTDFSIDVSDQWKLVLSADVGHETWGAQPLVPESLSYGSGIPGVSAAEVDSHIVLGQPSQNDPGQRYTEQNYWDVSAKSDYESSYGTITSVSAFQSLREPELQDEDVSGIPFVYGKLENIINAVSQELRFSSPSDQSLRWIVGGFFEHVDRDLNIDPIFINENLLATGNVSNSEAIWVPFEEQLQSEILKSYAVFGHADYDITKSFQLSLGGRYDIDPRTDVTTGFSPGNVPVYLPQKATFREFQPKVSLRYLVDPNSSVYVTVARGFRPGGFNAGANAEVQQAFPAETTTTYELGTKLSWLDQRLNMSAAVYYTDYKNQQLSLILVSTGAIVQDTYTVKRTKIKGAEFELQAVPASGLELSTGLSYTDATIAEFGNALSGAQFDPSAYIGKQVPNVMKYTANVAAQYTRPLTAELSGVVRTDLKYNGPMYWEPDNAIRNPPYALVDFSAGVKTDRWDLRLYGKNILDKRYIIQYFQNNFTQAPGGFDFAALSRRDRFGLEGTWRF
jgi:iron complex outermembrane recepter protein